MRLRLAFSALALAVLALSFTTAFAQPRRITVGDGTPASCTEFALANALDDGGSLTLDFNCGRRLHVITMTEPLPVRASTIIDGGGRIWLSGGRTTQIFRVFNHHLELNNMILFNGAALSPTAGPNAAGGAIYLSGGTLRLRNVNFIGSRGTSAGAVMVQDGVLEIDRAIFQSNRADRFGGALMTVNTTVTMNGATFRQNRLDGAGGAGGAVSLNGGAAALDSVTVERNVSAGRAGGVHVEGASALTVRGATFTGNTATDAAGGLLAQNTSVTISGSLFQSNAGAAGGALQMGSSGSPLALEIADTRFLSNRAVGESTSNSGGALDIGAFVSATITGSRFAGSEVHDRGAAIAFNGPSLTVRDTDFVRNRATNETTGTVMMLFASGTTTLTDVTFTGSTAPRTLSNLGIITLERVLAGSNSGVVYNAGRMTVNDSQFAFNRGGGIYSSGQSTGMELVVRESDFIANGRIEGGRAVNVAGGIALYEGLGGTRFNGTALIEDSRFIANAGIYGALLNRRTATRVENSVFYANNGTTIGGILNEQFANSTIDIVHSTIFGNTNGGVYNLRLGGRSQLINSIVQDAGFACRGEWTLLGTNLQTGELTCPGATAADARLDRSGRPGAGSPAFDAAAREFCLSDDIDDSARPQGAGCDIGAYELGMVVAPLVQATPAPTETLVSIPTAAPPTSTPRPAVNCAPFRPTSPLDGLPNGVATFYWDPAPGANGYRVLLFNEQGAQVGTFAAGAGTNVQGDVSTGAVGGGFTFSWQVQALLNDAVACTSAAVTTLRATNPGAPPPPAPSGPQCGNGIQEPGETQNTCPNGF